MGRIIVTGTSGFVGGEIAGFLTCKHLDIIGVSRSKPKREFFGNYQHENIDLSHKGEVKKLHAIKNVEAIIHCAGESSSNPDNNTFMTLEKNINIMNNLLAYAIKTNIDDFIFLSSKKVYVGDSGDLDAYATSKLICEEVLNYVNNKYNKKYVSIRLCNIYGEDNNHSRIIPYITKSILRGKAVHINSSPKTIVSLCSTKKLTSFIYDKFLRKIDCEGTIDIIPEMSISIDEIEKSIRLLISCLLEKNTPYQLSEREEKMLPTVYFYMKEFLKEKV